MNDQPVLVDEPEPRERRDQACARPRDDRLPGRTLELRERLGDTISDDAGVVPGSLVEGAGEHELRQRVHLTGESEVRRRTWILLGIRPVPQHELVRAPPIEGEAD